MNLLAAMAKRYLKDEGYDVRRQFQSELSRTGLVGKLENEKEQGLVNLGLTFARTISFKTSCAN
jgi:hypothetical protein